MENTNNKKNIKVAVFGTLSKDLIFDVDSLPNNNTQHIFSNSYIELHGGAAANVCAYLAGTLDIDSYIISAVGSDELGKELVSGMIKLNVNTSGITKIKNTISSCIATIQNIRGERLFIVNTGAIDLLSINDLNIAILNSCDLLYIAPNKRDDLSSYMIEYCKKKNKLVAFNPGPAYLNSNERKDIAINLINKTDFVFFNRLELLTYSRKNNVDDACEYILSKGAKYVVVTCDKDGCLVATKDYKCNIKSLDLEVIDPTGAGDAFAAGFIGIMLLYNDIESALEFANGLGAFKVQHKGLREIIPKNSDILKLIEKHKSEN